MSTPNPALVAVAPEVYGILQALQAFDNSMGPDPAKWPGNFAPAKLVLDGTVLKQLQLMAPALGGVAVTELNGFWGRLIAKVQADTGVTKLP